MATKKTTSTKTTKKTAKKTETISSSSLADELKKYNEELEKHITSIDVEYVKNSLATNSSSGKDKEFHTLFTQNLLDLRTEVSLLRKNLSVDIEGMVMKVVTSQQNEFSEKMNNLFLQSTLDMKTYLNETLNQFGQGLAEIKKSHNNIAIQNENLNSQMSTLSTEVNFIKNSLQKQDTSSSHIQIHQKIDDIQNKLDFISSQTIEKNKVLSNQIQHLSNFTETIKNEHTNSLKKILTETKKSPKIQKVEIEKHFIPTPTPDKIIPEVKINNRPTPNLDDITIPTENENVEVIIPSRENLPISETKLPNKILDIDARLSKLNALKK